MISRPSGSLSMDDASACGVMIEGRRGVDQAAVHLALASAALASPEADAGGELGHRDGVVWNDF